MALFLVLEFSVLLAIFSFASADCDRSIQTPITVPVRNVTLAGQHLRRGLDFQIGSPPQQLALALSMVDNNTYLYDESPQCGSLPTTECTLIRGGSFDESISSSWQSYNSFSDLGALDSNEPAANAGWLAGVDTWTLNSSFQVEKFPVGIPRNDAMPFSQLGMGKYSSLLTVLRNQGSIASRSFSFWWGQTGITSEHQSDGALVLGGIDTAKITGNNYTASVDLESPCGSGMVVTVTDMALVYPNGTSASIMTGGEVGQSVNYCIAPEFPMITMLQEQWEQWMARDIYSVTDGDADSRAQDQPNLWGLVYPPDMIFSGDLKVTIDGSLEVVIPNHQLVQTYYSFDSSGDQIINNTVLELMVNPLQDVNENDLPKFGMTFFQAAYLHVNYDANEFTIWQAKPTKNELLVGIGNSTQGCAVASNATGSASSPDASSGSSVNPSSNHQDKARLSNGAIGGIAVGVFGAVAALLAVVARILYLRRRRWQLETSHHGNQDQSSWEKTREPGMPDSVHQGQLYQKWELDSSSTTNTSQLAQQHGIGPGSADYGSGKFASTVPEPMIQELPVQKYD